MSLPFEDPVLIFASVMALILIAPLFARKLKLPEIVGLIVAGIVVGPYGFGILARDDTIQLLGTVGLLFIMFLAGLEIDLNQVRRKKSYTVIFGFLTFLIPLGLGTAMGVWIFGMNIWASVLLASMFSSHTLLTFPVVGKLGLAKASAVTTAIGGTIITDTLALLLLAVIASATQGEIDSAFWIRLFLLMTVYVVAALFLIPLIGRWFFRKVDSDENSEFVFVIALTFASAYLAHVAGLEPIIGAFLAGLTLNSLIPERSLLMTRIHFSGDAIFIPFFLLSVGMLVDVSLLFTATEAWVVLAGMVIVALAAKYLAALLSGKLLKYSKDHSNLIFGLSVNQAAATLAAVLVGYDIGLFDETIITGTIIMIAVTCFVGSIVTERSGRKVALQKEQAHFDTNFTAHRILIPIKERVGAKELLDISFLLREKSSSEPLYPIKVIEEEGGESEEMVAAAEKTLAHSVVRTLAAGVPVIPITTVDVNVSAGLLRSIRGNRITMVVLGWDGTVSAKTRVFGRYIDTVIERTSQMVMINRNVAPINTTGRIVVVLPPLAHRDIGFNELIATIKTLANQAGTSLLFLSTKETYENTVDFIKKTRPSVQVAFDTYSTWKMVSFKVDEVIEDDDWLILMSVRKGEIAWQPTLDRMPAVMAHKFQKVNFSVIFTPTERRKSVQIAENTSFLTSVFTPRRMLFNVETEDVQGLIYKLLGTHFSEHSPIHNRLATLIYKISQEEPVELVEDVVLLHTYVPYLSETLTFLGISKNSLNVPLASGKPHVVIILLDPVGQDPASHLRALADIANLIRLPGIVDVLKSALDFEELVERITVLSSEQPPK
ncbi:cation:proton antiporter [Chitinispirillales bacterium ANBcel5]|uniref:cation:proton antiporter domain-containing protein n=1 Tax=Cellulosispirillum alkaliphilum TaxID=3039283 RepID=UPI002A517EED|nr:cation:proton antiporter [Chitinispirillales bacterium ANBcel5]